MWTRFLWYQLSVVFVCVCNSLKSAHIYSLEIAQFGSDCWWNDTWNWVPKSADPYITKKVRVHYLRRQSDVVQNRVRTRVSFNDDGVHRKRTWCWFTVIRHAWRVPFRSRLIDVRCFVCHCVNCTCSSMQLSFGKVSRHVTEIWLNPYTSH